MCTLSTTMHAKTHNVLAIIPVTKYLGVAIFIDTDLRDWFVKSIPNIPAKEKSEYVIKFISGLIERFNINVLAVKKLHPARQSKNLSDIVSKIKGVEKKMNVSVSEFSLHAIEQFLIEGKLNKKRLAEEITQLYPVVFHEYEREKRNRSRYLTRMFEAIALGIVCFNQLDNGKKKVAAQHQ